MEQVSSIVGGLVHVFVPVTETKQTLETVNIAQPLQNQQQAQNSNAIFGNSAAP